MSTLQPTERDTVEESIMELLLYDPPQLDDEMAVQMVDFFHELLNAIENHYSFQLRRYYDDEAQLPLKLPFGYGTQSTDDQPKEEPWR
ncbi:MAG: hypothetical protein HOE82_15575 [Gammaproteobacteria bacterium]|jgi:hypothetical protein|nr:hypothetical protein [Gammaproteobacteria bacterium]MBT5635525.1 hypothetical protein [Gammaproteobacteria bacterium]